MSKVAFADVVHQTIYFSPEIPSESLVLDLIETKWVQRLREIGQTGSGKLVYMFSEHSRFGHSMGVAYLANHLMDQLAEATPELVNKYRLAISAAALLHDVGHIAPGSHAAYKAWFPNASDVHESISTKIILEDPEISGVLKRYDPALPELVGKILDESEDLPPWTWEIISGGGWNVDRGNWCIVDSVMAGVTYGRYNIPALLESIVIDPSGHLVVKENRLDAMVHFAIARHSMYRQVYQHRVLLAAEKLNRSVVQRARDLGSKLSFADEHCARVLKATTPIDLPLSTIFAMQESWWRYHLSRWSHDPDPILRDLAERVLYRRLLKTVRIRPEDDRTVLLNEAEQAVKRVGFDPRYYLYEISGSDVHAGDLKQSMMVQLDDGRLESLAQSEPLWGALMSGSKKSERHWIALPAEAKKILGRAR